MLSVTEAQGRLLALLSVGDPEMVPLDEAYGRVLAEPVKADWDWPLFANSSMDGFAVRAADLKRANPAKPRDLKVVGDIPAGQVADKRLRAGEAMRIMTGAPLPKGADAVVPIEDTNSNLSDRDAPLPKRVRILRGVERGAYVRSIGQDFASGQKLLYTGKRLRPQDIAILAMLGRREVSVCSKPKVAHFSSGDELIESGEKLLPGKIYESNSHSLGAQVESCGAFALKLGIAPDDLQQIQAHLNEAVEQGADIIITSAGVSVGAFDFLRDALLSDGELDFWRVNMRPGKPLAVGKYRGVPYIGLPGNPVSAFVSFELFARPALNKMAGVNGWQQPSFRAMLKTELESDGRQSYLRATYQQKDDNFSVELTGHQGSGNLYSLVQANCLLVVPAGVKRIESGSMVEIWPL